MEDDLRLDEQMPGDADALTMIHQMGVTATVRVGPGDDPDLTMEITGPADLILEALRVLLSAWPAQR